MANKRRNEERRSKRRLRLSESDNEDLSTLCQEVPFKSLVHELVDIDLPVKHDATLKAPMPPFRRKQIEPSLFKHNKKVG